MLHFLQKFMYQFRCQQIKLHHTVQRCVVWSFPRIGGGDPVAICRLIAWNVLLHRDAPELDKEVVDWANAMRVYTHVVDYPAVYRMDSIDDLRHLNAMAHLSMQYMRNESDRRQANCYKTYEDVEKYASNPKESLQYRRKTAE